MSDEMTLLIQPISLGMTFSKAQSSKLVGLFYCIPVKRGLRALSFELWKMSCQVELAVNEKMKHRGEWIVAK